MKPETHFFVGVIVGSIAVRLFVEGELPQWIAGVGGVLLAAVVAVSQQIQRATDRLSEQMTAQMRRIEEKVGRR